MLEVSLLVRLVLSGHTGLSLAFWLTCAPNSPMICGLNQIHR